MNLPDPSDTVNFPMVPPSTCTSPHTLQPPPSPHPPGGGKASTSSLPGTGNTGNPDTPTMPPRPRGLDSEQHQLYLEGRLSALEDKLGLFPTPQAGFAERLKVASDALKSASLGRPEVCISDPLQGNGLFGHHTCACDATPPCAAAAPPPPVAAPATFQVKEVIHGLDQVQAEIRALRMKCLSVAIRFRLDVNYESTMEADLYAILNDYVQKITQGIRERLVSSSAQLGLDLIITPASPCFFGHGFCRVCEELGNCNIRAEQVQQ
ncbi:hypothetical protein C8R46DRAFT_1044805 [Mycena filopes]|nr:hypothetical protein C8R46DRAFT_1044805 [Mycena filopes]